MALEVPITQDDQLQMPKFRQVMCEDGCYRNLYTFKDVNGVEAEVMFLRGEEMPFAQEFAGKFTNLISTKSKLSSEEDWKEYRRRLATTKGVLVSPDSYLKEDRLNDQGIYVVRSSPQDLKLFARLLSGGEVGSPEVEQYGWQLLAATAVLNHEGQPKEKLDDESPLLLVEAYRGSKVAIEEMRQRASKYSGLERANIEAQVNKIRAELDTDEYENAERLDFKDLALVHTTRYLPRTEGDRKFTIRSTFDGSGTPRNTIHFSLNHAVAGHMYGSWDDVPYVVIAPLEDAVAESGLPAVLSTVDTFYELAPDERLVLPVTTVVAGPDTEGRIPQGEIMKAEGNMVLYTQEVSPDTCRQIYKRMNERSRNRLSTEIAEVISTRRSYLRDGADNLNFQEKDVLIEPEKLDQLRELLRDLDVFGMTADASITEVIENLFRDVGIERPSSQELQAKVLIVQGTILGLIRAAIKNSVVTDILRSKGFEERRGGMWAWEDSWVITERTIRTGVEKGIPVMAHDAHITTKVMEQLIGGFGFPGLVNELRRGEITLEEYKQRCFEFVQFVPGAISSKTLQMLYAFGIL